MNVSKLIHNLKLGDPVPVPPEPRPEREIMASWRGDIDKPLVSIICHTYNHVKYIKDSLNGFLMQETDFPFEIIVHDDASSDGTNIILNEYKEKYPRILRVIIQEENQFQKGIRPQSVTFPRSFAKYIAFCEGDDYWIDKKKIFRQAHFLESNLDYSLVFTDSIHFFNGTRIHEVYRGSRKDLTQDQLKHAPAIFTLTSCFRNVLDYPIELNFVGYGDKFLWSRLGNFGKGKFMPQVLPSFYRVHDGGIFSNASNKAKRKMQLQTHLAMSLYYRRLGETDLENYFFEKTIISALSLKGISPILIPIMCSLTRAIRKSKNVLAGICKP